MRSWISRLSWSIAAAAAEHDHGNELGRREAAVLLPLWGTVTVDGVRVESRIIWGGGEVVRVLRGVSTPISWRTAEREQSETTRIAELTVSHSGEVVVTGDWPDGALAPVAADSLSAVVGDGELAEWAMLDALEPFVRRQLHLVSMSIGTELGSSGAITLYSDPQFQNSVVDGLTIDRLAVSMLYGQIEEGRSIPPLTRNLLRKYASDASAVARVPLTTYLETNVRRQADGRIRSAIGDSSLGPRIRRVAATLRPDATPEEVLERCREIGISGTEALGIRRVREALTARLRVSSLVPTHAMPDADEDAPQLQVPDQRSDLAFEQIDTVDVVAGYQRRVGLQDPDELWLAWQLDVGDHQHIGRDEFHAAAAEACAPTATQGRR
ncbi:hypothetical protein [Curtobacterium sp. 20TX0008]|uniref:hypothetical protein n=1 Tax=Curtobacterium sp. 20TX0008 TaxID=3022018 RepID=UPI00232DF416|nr:hypothetical protein [Curtobacterium sp. 20TX0008]MDB6425878.1 hypothetical protein [Curtobacterium sp. 20TX0008]